MDFYAPAGQRCLVIWEIQHGVEMPTPLRQFAETFSGSQPQGESGVVSETWKYFRHGKPLQLGYCLLNR